MQMDKREESQWDKPALHMHTVGRKLFTHEEQRTRTEQGVKQHLTPDEGRDVHGSGTTID